MSTEKVFENRKPSRSTEWGEFQGAYKFEDPVELPEDYRKILFKLIYVQAETEFASVLMHKPFLSTGPTHGDRLMQSRIIADEMRHAWQMSELLKPFGKEGDEAIEHLLNQNLGDYKLEAFNMDFEDWVDMGAFLCIMDRVGDYQLSLMEGCSYAPLARVIPLMVTEEKFHINSGFNVLKRVATDDTYIGNKEAAQKAVNKWYPRALDGFGNSGSEWSEKLVRFGIKKWDNVKARETYKEEVNGLLTKIGLEIPDEFEGRRFV
jgi:1,2-phenylacetyl-CoA epoxidase catalytic subunit